ncbi:MAG TPA: MFS transporter [Candidatus Binatia bacterium]|nr:MFS transporter [Candidatus Binatia bacterium]
METAAANQQRLKSQGIFYGWYIVGVGFLANVASSFALASTLSIFLKPLTAELGISRGVFSLLRSGEGIIAACLAPLVGTLVDRYGGRWLMVIGAAIAGAGFLLLGYIETFAQFTVVRLTLVTFGDVMMGYMVVNVVVAQWFVRLRGRAFAFTSMGVGFAKVCMPILAAWLLLSFGWRQTWMVFGVLTMALLMLPALLVVRRTPEDMGLRPDGVDASVIDVDSIAPGKKKPFQSSENHLDIVWTRAAAVRTSAFWLLVITFGISSVGVTGLNLHVYPYVTDIGHPPVVAATVMSVIASMQLASPLVWGFLAERVDPRIAAMLRFIVQGVGLGLAISTSSLICLYTGFFLYGIGLGGNMVLPDLLWANYFGRRSLGKIRGMGLLISQVLAAFGPPFFGFLFDATGGYGLSFALFGAALATSAVLSLMLKPPTKAGRST